MHYTKHTSPFAIRRLTLGDVIRSREFNSYANDLFLSDSDRADRIWDAAEDGGDGSTHAEVIEDWRDFLDTVRLPWRVLARIVAEIDDCEKWHYDNGSLHHQID